ncbi:MAG: hypothetical protein QOG77_1036, partial [Solirubrobacteraceae bacterium]|nr:hypothetical protein [Solirubrobacteraceae bacterium]
RDAAATALARGAPGSAADYLERALREPPPEPERPVLLGDLGRAQAAAGRAAASGHLAAAVEATRAPQTRLRLLLDLGRALQHAGAMSEATATFQRGLDEVRPGAGELATDLEAGFLAAAMHAPERAADAHRRADVIVAEDLRETPAERALLCNAMMMRFFAGRPREEVLAVVHRLYAAGALIDESAEDPTTLMQVIGVLSWSDEYRDADLALRGVFAAAGRRGSVFTFAMASQIRARQALRTGPLGDAVDDARAAIDAWRGGLQAYVHASAYCLVAALLDGDEAAEAARAIARAERGSHHVSAWRHMALGRLAAHEERHEDALDAFLAAGRRLDALLVVNPAVMPWRSEAGLAARRLGREAQARELIGSELGLARRHGSPYAIGVAQIAAGLLERGEDAVLRLREAAGTLGGVGAPVAEARALAHLGAATRRAGRAVEARGILRDAVALAEGSGAATVAREARAEMRLAGGRVPVSTPAGDGLTPSERRVAERAAAGETNREIAAALFITVKAVEWHLGNTYRKLAVRGRGELAGALGST